MAQYNSTQGNNQLIIHGRYINELDIESFSLMLKDPSYCYKFYWLEALVKLVSEGKLEFTFDDMINEMIASAWYSVREFHIHLSGIQNGEVRDGLERSILLLSELSGLLPSASKTEILNAIKEFDSDLRIIKNQLTNMVPYRALAGFFNRVNESPRWNAVAFMRDYIGRVNNSIVELPYTLGSGTRLKKEIYVSKNWANMIQDNTVSILGWIQYEKVKWLQSNNPEVPGLVFKLAPLDMRMRKLDRVHKLWDGIIDCQPITDVFTGQTIEKNSYDVDHFIPWSFVMNDELWNLMPMDSSLNSSKNNRLPLWEPFFRRFAENQFLLYRIIQDKAGIHDLYKSCYRDNLHSIWAMQELYRPGNTKLEFMSILEKNMQPVYDSAHRQGYEIWNYI